MEKELAACCDYVIERIYEQTLGPIAYRLCPMMRDRYTDSDASPLKKYMDFIADSPVFKTFANRSKTSDSDAAVDDFLQSYTFDPTNADEPFVESSDPFDVMNETAIETVELYKSTNTDMFAHVRNKNMKDTSIPPFDLSPTEGLYLVVGKCADMFQKLNIYRCVLTFRSIIAAYYRDMRLQIQKEETTTIDGMKYSQAASDASFLQVVSERVSVKQLESSFQTWFLETFTKYVDNDDLSNEKDQLKVPDVQYQYFALLVVFTIALSRVTDGNSDLEKLIKYLISDTKWNLVWQCVSIILFGLSNSQVRNVLRSKPSIALPQPITHVIILFLCRHCIILTMSINL